MGLLKLWKIERMSGIIAILHNIHYAKSKYNVNT